MKHYDYWRLLGPAVTVIVTIFSMLYWSQLGKAGRAAVKWARSVWQDERETIQGLSLLTGTLLLAWGWAWLRYILTHEVE